MPSSRTSAAMVSLPRLRFVGFAQIVGGPGARSHSVERAGGGRTDGSRILTSCEIYGAESSRTGEWGSGHACIQGLGLKVWSVEWGPDADV
jgi:hypothetical protein